MKIIRTPIGPIILLLASALYADVHISTSVDIGAVRRAIEASSDGDTVMIPAGTAVWNSYIPGGITKGITLKGAGMDQTVIIDDTWNYSTNANNGTPFQVTVPAGQKFRVCHMTIQGYDGVNYTHSSTPFSITGQNWRIDHCRFVNLGGVLAAFDNRCALIDH